MTVRTVNRLPDVTAAQFDNLQHFFRTDGFQRWALDVRNHREAKMPKLQPKKAGKPSLFVWRWYKVVLKMYVFEGAALLTDKERTKYFVEKEKVGSLQHAPSHHFAIDDALNTISFGGFSTDRHEMTAKYGNSLQRYLLPGAV